MGDSSASWTAAASARRGSALDLVAAWHLLDETRRDILRRELECGEVQWWRGMAWAFQQAMGLVRYYLDSNPTMSRWGGRTLDRIVGGWTVPRERPGRPFTRAR